MISAVTCQLLPTKIKRKKIKKKTVFIGYKCSTLSDVPCVMVVVFRKVILFRVMPSLCMDSIHFFYCIEEKEVLYICLVR